MNGLLDIIAGRDTDSLFEVRCRDPRSGKITVREWFPATHRAPFRAFVDKHAPTLDVYVGAAPRVRRGGKKKDIRRAWACWVDCDEDKSPGCVERLMAFRPSPTLIVSSGSGVNCHAWWALTEPLPQAWAERANERLRCRLGATLDKCSNFDRVLRVPGSFNHKTTPPVEVTAESFDGSRMSAASVVKNLGDPPSFRPSVKSRPDTFADDPLDGVSAERYYTILSGRAVTRGNVQCPFHGDGKERNPSMALYDTTFNCFGCGIGGSVYEFAAALWGYRLPLRGDAFKEVRGKLTDALN